MNWNDLAVALILVGLFTFALIRDRLARADVVVEPTPPPIAVVGNLREDVDHRGAFAGHSLVVEDVTGHPPAITTYRLVTTHARQADLLGHSRTRTIRVVGRVGERGGEFYFLIDSVSEHYP